MHRELEEWVDVAAFEGYYQVSNLGRVRSLKIKHKNGVSTRIRILKGSKVKGGYIKYRLYKDCQWVVYFGHRLVAISFLKNPENKPRVNHKDNTPSNNIVSNLEWATHQEDVDHKVRQNRQANGCKHGMWGRRGDKSPASKLVLDLNTGVFYDSVKEAAAATSRDYKYLCDKLRGRYDNNTPLRYV